HQRPALEHHEAREQRHGHGNQRRDDQRIDHELELEGHEQIFGGAHSAASSASAARRRAASMPCLGAKKKARRKIAVCMMTRKAPTVCMAATVEAESSTKKTARRSVGLRPMERAWFSSKKVTIRSFHLASRMASETKPIMASCSVSSGVMARILPRTMVWI